MPKKNNDFWKFRTKHGRKKTFEDPETLWRQACKYFEWATANPLQEEKVFGTGLRMTVDHTRAYTLKALCFFLGITEQTWNNYQKRKEFDEVVEAIETVIYEQKFTGAAAGLLNPAIIARDLGLRDNVNTNIEKTLQDLSDEDLEVLAGKIIAHHKQRS